MFIAFAWHFCCLLLLVIKNALNGENKYETGRCDCFVEIVHVCCCCLQHSLLLTCEIVKKTVNDMHSNIGNNNNANIHITCFESCKCIGVAAVVVFVVFVKCLMGYRSRVCLFLSLLCSSRCHKTLNANHITKAAFNMQPTTMIICVHATRSLFADR